MKLFASILTTAVITGSVWGLVVLQPAMADSTQQAQINNEFSDVSHDVKRGDTPQQYLRGVTKTISLESLSPYLRCGASSIASWLSPINSQTIWTES